MASIQVGRRYVLPVNSNHQRSTLFSWRGVPKRSTPGTQGRVGRRLLLRHNDCSIPVAALHQDRHQSGFESAVTDILATTFVYLLSQTFVFIGTSSGFGSPTFDVAGNTQRALTSSRSPPRPPIWVDTSIAFDISVSSTAMFALSEPGLTRVGVDCCTIPHSFAFPLRPFHAAVLTLVLREGTPSVLYFSPPPCRHR
jgi:hypothetical protein